MASFASAADSENTVNSRCNTPVLPIVTTTKKTSPAENAQNKSAGSTIETPLSCETGNILLDGVSGESVPRRTALFMNDDEDNLECPSHEQDDDAAVVEGTTPLALPTEPDAVRTAREAAETEALIWQLVQEEQAHAYRAQMDYLRQLSAGLSEEDRAALQAAVAEGLMQSTASTRRVRQQRVERAGDERGENENADENDSDNDDDWEDDDDDSNQHDDNDEEEFDANEVDVDNMDYEELLELERRNGDEKQRRWRLRSAETVGQLRTLEWESAALDCDAKRLKMEEQCAVCRETFTTGDCLKVLPCWHVFHGACADAWLRDVDACPLCKQSILVTAG